MEPNGRRHLWWRLAGAGVLLVALGVLVRWALKEELDPRTALLRVRELQAHPWGVPAFFGAYVGLTTLFIPATLFHMVSGAAFGFPFAVGFNVAAFNVTSNLHFLFARRYGRAAVAEGLGALRIRRIEARLAQDGLRAAVLVRVLPLPNMAVNVTAGLSPLRWRDFAIGSAIGGLPYVLVYTYFGAALVEGLAGAKEKALLNTLAAAAMIAVLTVASRLLAKRKKVTPEG